MFASAGLAEERIERVVPTTDGLVTGHLAVWLDSMLQTVQLPASIAHLDTGLTNMDADTLTHVVGLLLRKLRRIAKKVQRVAKTS
jgi:hypothetical protein